MSKKRKPKQATEEIDEPEGGIEVVPLWSSNFKEVKAPWGPQYISGPLIDEASGAKRVYWGLSFPGVPIKIKSRAYAEAARDARLLLYPDEMAVDRLAESFRKEYGNPERWPPTLEAPKPEKPDG